MLIRRHENEKINSLFDFYNEINTKLDNYDFVISNSPICILPLNADSQYDEHLDDDDILYLICICPQLRNTINWINRNICVSIHKDAEETTGVRLRVATNMIMKLPLDPPIKRHICENLTMNVRREKLKLYKEYVAMQFRSLPF